MGDEEEVDKDERAKEEEIPEDGADNSIVSKTKVDSGACESAIMLLVALLLLSLLLLRCSPDVQEDNGDRWLALVARVSARTWRSVVEVFEDVVGAMKVAAVAPALDRNRGRNKEGSDEERGNDAESEREDDLRDK